MRRHAEGMRRPAARVAWIVGVMAFCGAVVVAWAVRGGPRALGAALAGRGGAMSRPAPRLVSEGLARRALGLLDGSAGRVDAAEARDLLEAARDLGDPLATLYLAAWQAEGRFGLAEDAAAARAAADGVARRWSARAERGEPPDAAGWLALAMAVGAGALPNDHPALLRLAALARLELDGSARPVADPGPRDRAFGALPYLEHAANLGHPYAKTLLGGLLAVGGARMERAPEAARRLHEEAAAAGSAVALYSLGCVFDYGLTGEPDPARALEFYRRAADRGFPAALNSVGVFHHQGRAPLEGRDPAEALRLFRAGARAGDPTALYNVAWLTERRALLEEERAEALAWYRLAVRAGDRSAAARLDYLEPGWREATPPPPRPRRPAGGLYDAVPAPPALWDPPASLPGGSSRTSSK